MTVGGKLEIIRLFLTTLTTKLGTLPIKDWERQAYRAGDYWCEVSYVSHLWTEDDWIRWIRATGGWK